MKKFVFPLLFLIFLASTFGAFGIAEAQTGLVPCGNTPTSPCNFCHIFQLLNNIIVFLLIPDGDLNNFLPLVPILAGLLIAIGGFYLLTSAANPQNQNRGRTILFAVVVGLLIIYGSWLFISLLLNALGFVSFGGSGGSWYEISCTFS